jgi:hypothetical protein
LDRPDDANGDVIVWRLVKQLHLFAPVHALAFSVVGGILLRQIPLSRECDPRILGLARITILVAYEVAVVPLLTLASAFAVRGRFRDAVTRHAALVSLILQMAVFAWMLGSAISSYRRQDERLRAFGAEILRCAYDGTPPSQIASPR